MTVAVVMSIPMGDGRNVGRDSDYGSGGLSDSVTVTRKTTRHQLGCAHLKHAPFFC